MPAADDRVDRGAAIETNDGGNRQCGGDKQPIKIVVAGSFENAVTNRASANIRPIGNQSINYSYFFA